jgi:2-iminoacetate synthase ThiH
MSTPSPYEMTDASQDFLELGTMARAETLAHFPHQVVTYTLEPDHAVHLEIEQGQSVQEAFNAVSPGAERITPVGRPDLTATEYLKLVAECRLAFPDRIIQVDLSFTGLKTAQLALYFGANDWGSLQQKPSSAISEEEARRTIREAGFKPKRRDADYRFCYLD